MPPPFLVLAVHTIALAVSLVVFFLPRLVCDLAFWAVCFIWLSRSLHSRVILGGAR